MNINDLVLDDTRPVDEYGRQRTPYDHYEMNAVDFDKYSGIWYEHIHCSPEQDLTLKVVVTEVDGSYETASTVAGVIAGIGVGALAGGLGGTAAGTGVSELVKALGDDELVATGAAKLNQHGKTFIDLKATQDFGTLGPKKGELVADLVVETRTTPAPEHKHGDECGSTDGTSKKKTLLDEGKKAKDTYNANLDQVPGPLRALVGDERISVTIEPSDELDEIDFPSSSEIEVELSPPVPADSSPLEERQVEWIDNVFSPEDVVVGDFNGDGRDTVRRWNGDGFEEPPVVELDPEDVENLRLGKWSWGENVSPVAGDFDGDGKDSFGVVDEDRVVDISGWPEHPEQTPKSTPKVNTPERFLDYNPMRLVIIVIGDVVAGDFNLDEIPVRFIEKNGEPEPAMNRHVTVVATPQSFNNSYTVGDFDGDGRDTIKVLDSEAGEWIEIDGPEDFSENWEGDPSLDLPPIVGDFDGNGRDMIHVWNPETKEYEEVPDYVVEVLGLPSGQEATPQIDKLEEPLRIGITTDGGKVTDLSEGGLDNPTATAELSEALAWEIALSDDPGKATLRAINDGKVRYESHRSAGIGEKVKTEAAKIAIKVYFIISDFIG